MYGKLHESIFGSSIMEQDLKTRYVWMCMIAIADKEGFVDATIPSLARKFNIDVNSVKRAIDYFLQPDGGSRTPDDDGRRLRKIRDSFGWQIINYMHYRDLKGEEEHREYMRDYMRKYRKGKPNEPKKTKGLQKVNKSLPLTQLTHTDTDTDTDTDTEEINVPLNDNSNFLVTGEKILEYQNSYPNINIEHELRMIRQWNIDNPSKRKTRTGILRHINSWLTDTANKRIESEQKSQNNTAPYQGVQYQARDWEEVRAEKMGEGKVKPRERNIPEEYQTEKE